MRRRRISPSGFGIVINVAMVERPAAVPQAIKPFLHGFGVGGLEQGLLVRSKTAAREICAPDLGNGSATAAEYVDFRVKALLSVDPVQLTDAGKISECFGVGQVAPKTHDSPD